LDHAKNRPDVQIERLPSGVDGYIYQRKVAATPGIVQKDIETATSEIRDFLNTGFD
jgi:hypothetical protein